MNVLGDITGRESVQLAAVGDTEFVYYVVSAPKQEVSSEEALSGPDSNAWAAAIKADCYRSFKSIPYFRWSRCLLLVNRCRSSGS